VSWSTAFRWRVFGTVNAAVFYRRHIGMAAELFSASARPPHLPGSLKVSATHLSFSLSVCRQGSVPFPVSTEDEYYLYITVRITAQICFPCRFLPFRRRKATACLQVNPRQWWGTKQHACRSKTPQLTVRLFPRGLDLVPRSRLQLWML